VRRGDPGLELVRPRRAQGEAALERQPALLDLAAVPERPVLLIEQHELSVPHPRLAPRVLEEQQRVQPVHLRLVGHQRREQRGEADRLRAQLTAHGRAVAAVEDEVDDGEHGAKPFRQQVVGRHA
jgi:hypothetical protein